MSAGFEFWLKSQVMFSWLSLHINTMRMRTSLASSSIKVPPHRIRTDVKRPSPGEPTEAPCFSLLSERQLRYNESFIHTSWKSHEECLISSWKGSCDVFAFAEIQAKGMDGSSKEWGCLNNDKMRIWMISEVGQCFKMT